VFHISFQLTNSEDYLASYVLSHLKSNLHKVIFYHLIFYGYLTCSIHYFSQSILWNEVTCDINTNTKLTSDVSVSVKKEIQNNEEEAIRIKEEAITELGILLAKTGQAEGR